MRPQNRAPKTDLLDLSREAVLGLNKEGKIIYWSRGAEQLYGWSAQDAAGRSPVELLKTELPRPLGQIENILRSEPYWDCELKQTTQEGKRITVASRWALWEEKGEHRGMFQLNMDITRRKQIENELRILSGRLLSLRDEERRRLARDLHDSVGQMLAGASMNLAMVQRRLPNAEPATLQLLQDLGLLIEQSVKEVRTLSYLLHPPLLDEVGLPSALEWYVSGFVSRSQINVELDIAPNLGRFRNELELALFRIVQETLTNVHRHSGSSTARITLNRLPSQVRLKVEDQGKGMSLPVPGEASEDRRLLGVGISGIRERVRNLGGQMQIRSGSSGTVVEVLFPIEETSSQGSAASHG
jgi:PAS domain S-box-containing protein